ncbi:MAG: type II secretion system minor pseudopilin GspK, partial [Gammaproteobacteria bacterium]
AARAGRGAVIGASADPAATEALAAVPAIAALRPAGVTRGSGGGPPAPLSDWEISVARFSLLLEALEIPADGLLPAVLDWVDADSETRFPNGAEDDYYADLDEPYRAANRPFGDVSELRLVRGVTPEIYAKLAPYVSALPAPTRINLNLAPVEVLMALGPGVDRATAEILDEARTTQPFESVESFTRFPLLEGRPLLAGGLDVATTWFALTMDASAGETALSARTLLARTSPQRVEIVRRTRGYFDAEPQPDEARR